MAIRYYTGELGTFDYDNEMYEILTLSGGIKDRLHLRDNYKGPIDLPKGLIDCKYLFDGLDLTGCYLRDFDTSSIIGMAGMFEGCKIPEGFTLGDKFDTSRVCVMWSMFEGCSIPKGFSLGDKFDTSNVKDMRQMFRRCEMLAGFTLGDKFDTSNVVDMHSMFADCGMPKGFTLGDKFDTSNVKDMERMFLDCIFPEGFSLDEGADPASIVECLKKNSNDRYDFSLLHNVPTSTLRECSTLEEFIELVNKYCKK